MLPARAAQPVAQRKAVKVNAVFTKSKPATVKPKTIGAKKNIKKVAAKKVGKVAAKSDDGNWTLARTLSEKKLGEVGDNLGKGVQFGGFTAQNEVCCDLSKPTCASA